MSLRWYRVAQTVSQGQIDDMPRQLPEDLRDIFSGSRTAEGMFV